MSQFSEKLKYLIEESGTNIYQLAKNAGLDRTTIQRSITGERLPGTAFVEKLCDFLRVSPRERKDLMELYSINKIGEKTYAGRKYIKELIEQIATLHINGSSNLNIEKSFTIKNDITQNIKVFSGQYNVNNIIRDIMEEEAFNENNPKISLTVPFDYNYLFDCLHQLYWESNGQIEIQHIVRFSKNPHSQQNSNINLENLSHVLPFAFCIRNGYQPYYYYGTENMAKDISLTMPYYLFTSKRLVTLSSDFKTAILYNNDDIKSVYYDNFQKCLTQAKPFVNQLADCGDMLTTYFKAYKIAGQVTNVIEPQPCFGKYYTHEMVDKHLLPEVQHWEEVRQDLYKFYDSYNSSNVPSKCFFSIEGLKYMVNTGVMADLPPRFASPFTLQERKYLLKSLRDDIKKEDLIFCATDSSKFIISPFLTLQVHKGSGIVFIAADNNGIVSCTINEQSICDAFRDFFESLPESDLFYSKEETISVLDGFIEQLENMKD